MYILIVFNQISLVIIKKSFSFCGSASTTEGVTCDRKVSHRKSHWTLLSIIGKFALISKQFLCRNRNEMIIVTGWTSKIAKYLTISSYKDSYAAISTDCLASLCRKSEKGHFPKVHTEMLTWLQTHVAPPTRV